jgi:hypothetical protein
MCNKCKVFLAWALHHFLQFGPGRPNETAPAAGPRPDSPCRTGREDFRRPEIKIDGEDLVIMTEGDVMGVIDQTGAKKKAA